MNRPVTVRLSPTDLAVLGTSGTRDIDGRAVTLVADPALHRGDAIAECDATTVDARIAEGLDRVRQALSL